MRGWPFRMAIGGILAWTFALLLIPDAWAVQATPVSLSFTAVQGGANPTSQVVTISKSTSRQVGWKAVDNAAWLSAAPSSGILTTSGQIAVAVNGSGTTYYFTVTAYDRSKNESLHSSEVSKSSY